MNIELEQRDENTGSANIATNLIFAVGNSNFGPILAIVCFAIVLHLFATSASAISC